MSEAHEDLKERLLAAVEGQCKGDRVDDEVQTLLNAVETAPENFLKPVWALAEESRSEVLPQKIGDYQIEEILGLGGMGVVYRARQAAPLERTVALKVLRPGTLSKTAVARFELERSTLARLDHPNIAKVLDTGTCDNGQPFIAMELVEGPTITQYAREKNLSLADRIRLVQLACNAVAHAHVRGVIHRDLKPSNILVNENDGRPVPKVIDFGIAKVIDPDSKNRLTLTAQVLGTLEYVSPEVLDLGAASADARSDVFALGAILYELITGLPPVRLDRDLGVIQAFKAREAAVITPPVEMLLEAPPDHSVQPGEMRRELNCIVLHSLERDPDCRYQTPNDLADDLRRYLSYESINASPPNRLRRIQNFVIRNRAAVATAAIVLLALATALNVTAISYFQVRRSMQVAVKAQQEAEEAIELLGENTKIDGARDRASKERLAEFANRVEQLLDETDLASPKMQLALELKLADAYDNIGRFDDAKRVLTEAYQSSREDWAEAEDQFRASLAIAEHYVKTRRYADGLPLAKEAVDLAESGTRAERFDAEFALANALMGTGELKESATVFESVLESNSDVADPATLVPRSRAKVMYATVLFQLGKKEEAVEAALQGYEGHREVFGMSYPNTLMAGHNLATLYSLTLQKDKAITLFRDVLAARKIVLGADHPDTLMTCNIFANNLAKSGREDEAETLYRESIKFGDAKYGNGNPAGCLAAAGLAKLLVKREDFKAAIEQVNRCVTYAQTQYGADDWHVELYRNRLAKTMVQAGDPEQAIPLAMAAYKVLEEKLGPTHVYSTSAARNLVLAFESIGDEKQAKFWREKSIAK